RCHRHQWLQKADNESRSSRPGPLDDFPSPAILDTHARIAQKLLYL
ncbi:hypothetical protein SeLEV6574_g08513, partial [Synchytrium endobioticum]